MSPDAITVNPFQSIPLERRVRSLHIGVGPAIVTCEGEDPAVVKEGADFEVKTGGTVTVNAPTEDGARVIITYADEPQAAVPGPRPTKARNAAGGAHKTTAAKKARKK